MKKYIISLACVIACSFTSLYAQLINIAQTEDSSFTIDKVYAGVLSGLAYQPETKQYAGFNYLRIGAAVNWKITSKMTYRAWAFGEYETIGQQSVGFQSSYVQYAPHSKWMIDAGFGPTLAALQHRPHPVTMFGQFEPSTKARFPGGGPVAQVRYFPTATSMIGGGVSLRQNMLEYQLSGTIGGLQVTAFHQTCTNTTGAGFTYTKGRFSTTNIWKSDDAVGNFNTFTLHKKQQLIIYSDYGYSLPGKCIVRMECGIIKLVETKYLKAVAGIGYAHETKSVKSYLLVSL